MAWVWRLSIGAMLAIAGCGGGAREPRVVTNPDPSVKIPAIKQAVRQGDADVVPQLVKDLDSDDPAVRLYAIEALERLTGQTFGYRYFDDERERAPALKRWQEWLSRRNHPDTRNAASDATVEAAP
jgi:hypothetical protein